MATSSFSILDATGASQPMLAVLNSGTYTPAIVLSDTLGTPLDVLPIARKSVIVTPTITVSTAPAYTSGDNIGGKITLTGVMRAAAGIAHLTMLQLLDRANQKPNLTIFFFNADPTLATLTDNAAIVFSTNDLSIAGQVAVATADWVTTNSKATCTKSGLDIPIQAASGTSLYVAIVTTSTPTFSNTDDVQIIFAFEQE